MTPTSHARRARNDSRLTRAVAVVPHDDNDLAFEAQIYVGATGDVTVIPAGGTVAVTFTDHVAGVMLGGGLLVSRVLDTGTDPALNLVAVAPAAE